MRVPYPPGYGTAPDSRAAYLRLCRCRYARGSILPRILKPLTCGGRRLASPYTAKSHPEKYHKFLFNFIYLQQNIP